MNLKNIDARIYDEDHQNHREFRVILNLKELKKMVSLLAGLVENKEKKE